MPPSGPSVVALPQRGESLDQFQQNDYACRDYANRSTNSSGAAQAATTNSVNSTALGTLGGAALGVGGYAAGPMMLAAALRGLPTIVFEPNAEPGFTNRVLARMASLHPGSLRAFLDRRWRKIAPKKLVKERDKAEAE